MEGKDPGFSVWTGASGCTGDARLLCEGRREQVQSAPGPPHRPGSRLPNQGAARARAAANQERRERRRELAGAERAQTVERAAGLTGSECGESSTADWEPRASPARFAAATFQPTLWTLRAASQVTESAPRTGRVSVPGERGPAGGAGGGRLGR